MNTGTLRRHAAAGTAKLSRQALAGRERAGLLVEARLRHVALAAIALGLSVSPAGVELGATLAALASSVLHVLRAPRAAVVAACGLAAGMGLGDARIGAIDAAGERLEPGRDVSALAHLLTRPRPGPFGSSAEIRLTSSAAAGARLLARFPDSVRLPPTLRVGTELRLSGVARRPRLAHRATEAGGAPGPGQRAFDLAAHLRRRGLAGELAVRTATVTGRTRGGLHGFTDAARVRAERGVGAGLPAAEAALVRGMVLGQDEEIDPAVRGDFRASGLAHLLAVSGQNVMLLAALALPLLSLAGLPAGARIALTVALIAAYVPVAGAGPSLQRAGVMGAASLVALAAARPASRWHALLLAACATLALNPRAVEEPGWQLSFAAVAGMLLLVPGVRARLGALPRLLAEGVAVTVAATVATAPLLAHHFGMLPAAGLPANVVALPLVAPIMWLAMLRAGLGQLAPVAPGRDPPAPSEAVGAWDAQGAAWAVNDLLGLALEPLASALAAVARAFAELPGGQLPLPLGSWVAVVVAYAAIGFALLAIRRRGERIDAAPAAAAWRRLPRRRRAGIAAATGVAVALAFMRVAAPPAPPAELTVSFLDVGQGDATLVQHPDGSAVLFDGGPPEGRVARLLRRAGVRRLSALVMTHASRDHHGGLLEVVERYPVDLLLDGGDGSRDHDFRAVAAGAQRRGARRVAAVAPLSLQVGAISIEVLSPPPRAAGPPPQDPNPRAVVAVVRAEQLVLLLSADAESPSLASLALPDVDVMKVPHHGSSDPGLPALLRRLRPELAAIEVGRNSYGHPAPATLASLRAAGVTTLRTDLHGTIRLTAGEGGLRVRRERGEVPAGATRAPAGAPAVGPWRPHGPAVAVEADP